MAQRAIARPYISGEFERFVQRLAGPADEGTKTVRRFGAELMTGSFDARADTQNSLVPPEYALAVGDEVLITLWGSVNADLRLTVDRSGRISIPRVGSIQLAGVNHSEIAAVIERRVGQVFRNFQLSVSLGQLRALRVFVTGFVQQPGAYTVSALSTVLSALLQAGGPSAAGSFRRVELRRAGVTVSRFDLYDLLLRGDRSADQPIQAGDVVHVGPVGTQVAVIGSVHQPAIFDASESDTLSMLLGMAGGLTAVADNTRITAESLKDRAGVRIRELALPENANSKPAHGDVIRAFSAVSATLPIERQNKRVVVDGEFRWPGVYILPPESSMSDAFKAAGGLTPQAYLFGTEFSRESVRVSQQQNYERALRDLETELTRGNATRRTSSVDEAAAQSAGSVATERLLARLRVVQPNGRVVLQLAPDSVELPNLKLEDGDKIQVPPRASSVGVFGSVFNAGSYLYGDGRSTLDYLRLAGGATRGADESSIFVIRANGSVVSLRQQKTPWFKGDAAGEIKSFAGDTIFVPEENDKTTFLQRAKDWAQVFSQFGLGAAALKVLGN